MEIPSLTSTGRKEIYARLLNSQINFVKEVKECLSKIDHTKLNDTEE